MVTKSQIYSQTCCRVQLARFPRVHPSLRDQVFPLHPNKLLVHDHDFMMEEIERRELLNADEDIDGEGTGVDSDGDDDEDDDSVDDVDDDTDEE